MKDFFRRLVTPPKLRDLEGIEQEVDLMSKHADDVLADRTPSSSVGSPLEMSSEVPMRITPEDDEIVEEWVRFPQGREGGGIDVVRIADEGEWQWQVFVSALELVRQGQLEEELSLALWTALGSVPGSVLVAREDTELFIVDGNPSGEALAIAACAVVDKFAERIQAHIESLA